MAIHQLSRAYSAWFQDVRVPRALPEAIDETAPVALQQLVDLLMDEVPFVRALAPRGRVDAVVAE